MTSPRMAPPALLIERDGESWVLRMFGRQDTLISGPTIESAKEQAFESVRQWAPCRIRVMGEGFEEWRLEEADGEWVLHQQVGLE